LDNKKAVDSTKFKQIQDSNWKVIIEDIDDKRKKIKELIFSNFERLKSESDSFDKLNKPKEEIKDEMSKIIREEWYSYIKNIDNDLLNALVSSMRRSMEEMKKAIIGDKNKKEPKVFIMISTYWKANQ